MFPTFWTLTVSLQTARVGGIVAAVLLSLFIVWDAYRTHGKEKIPLAIVQAVLFFVIFLGMVLVFITPTYLPEMFFVPLRSWGLMVVVGMSSCFVLQRHFGRKLGLTGDQILAIWVYGGIAALFGARGLHVLVNLPAYGDNPLKVFTFWDGGMAFIGGLILCVVFSIFALRKWKQGLMALDALILGMALTHGFGRIGCFLAGCCYGRETGLPWGVSFPPGSIAQYTMAQAGQIDAQAHTAALHPTQLYAAATCFLIGLGLLAWYRRGTAKPGMIVCAYFVVYPLARFGLELFRNDPERNFLFRIPEDAPYVLSTTQSSALLLVPLAGFALWRLHTGRGLWFLPSTAQAAARSATSSSGC